MNTNKRNHTTIKKPSHLEIATRPPTTGSFESRVRQALGMPPESTDEEVIHKLTDGVMASAMKEFQARGLSYMDAWGMCKRDPRFTNYFKSGKTQSSAE